MAIEYTLRMADSNIDIKYIQKIFEKIGIEILEIRNLKLGFEVYKFNPDIKLYVTFVRKVEKTTGHPSNNYETIFLKKDFYYNELLSYRFEKSLDEQNLAETNIQFNSMLTSVFNIVRGLNKEALFTGSGGNEIFVFRNNKFIIESTYYDFFNEYHKDILQSYNCNKFDGNPL